MLFRRFKKTVALGDSEVLHFEIPIPEDAIRLKGVSVGATLTAGKTANVSLYIPEQQAPIFQQRIRSKQVLYSVGDQLLEEGGVTDFNFNGTQQGRRRDDFELNLPVTDTALFGIVENVTTQSYQVHIYISYEAR